MIYRVITEPRELIAKYVAQKCATEVKVKSYAAVGLVRDDVIVAGVTFYDYVWPAILMDVAADRMTPKFIAAVTYYPFAQLRCKSVVGFIKRRNGASRKFAEHWGAKFRGKIEEGAADDDLMVYQLMAADAKKWLSEKYMAKLALEVA